MDIANTSKLYHHQSSSPSSRYRRTNPRMRKKLQITNSNSQHGVFNIQRQTLGYFVMDIGCCIFLSVVLIGSLVREIASSFGLPNLHSTSQSPRKDGMGGCSFFKTPSSRGISVHALCPYCLSTRRSPLHGN